MERIPTRAKLLHREQPRCCITIEKYSSCVLVYGLSGDPKDYFVFSDIEEMGRFIANNYKF